MIIGVSCCVDVSKKTSGMKMAQYRETAGPGRWSLGKWKVYTHFAFTVSRMSLKLWCIYITPATISVLKKFQNIGNKIWGGVIINIVIIDIVVIIIITSVITPHVQAG